jgi:hypothetical protein
MFMQAADGQGLLSIGPARSFNPSKSLSSFQTRAKAGGYFKKP